MYFMLGGLDRIGKGGLYMAGKILTKKAKLARSFWIASNDVELWQAAAAQMGVSQSEFLRAAVRKHAVRVLSKNAKPENPARLEV